jgi:hypothetical protein
MILIQIILLIFIAFAIVSIIIRFKERTLSPLWATLWVIFWLAAAFVVIYPATTSELAKLVGVTRGADLIIYFSLMFLFFIIFRMQIKIEKIEREITKIVQDKALKNKQ